MCCALRHLNVIGLDSKHAPHSFSCHFSQHIAEIGVHALVDDVERRVAHSWFLAPFCSACADLDPAAHDVQIDSRVILIPISDEEEGTRSVHRGSDSLLPRAC